MESCSHLQRNKAEFKSWLKAEGIDEPEKHAAEHGDEAWWHESCTRTSTNLVIFGKWARRKLRGLSEACDSKGKKYGMDPLMACSEVHDDCHSMPQTAQVFFPNGDRGGSCAIAAAKAPPQPPTVCDHVLRYENVLGDLRELQSAYGLPQGTYSCMEPGSEKRVAIPPAFTLNASRITSKGIPTDILHELDRLYAVDMKNFNFCTHSHR